MTVSIIGTGNLAWHYLREFEEQSIPVAEVFTRSKKKAEDFRGYAYDVKIQTHLDFSDSPSTFFFLAVSDDALAMVATEIKLPPEAILIHSSGAKPLTILEVTLNRNPDAQLAVFYPLMTFSKGHPVDFRHVPICLEAETQSTLKSLTKLAKKISKDVLTVNSSQRVSLHIAAVFACNFVNHLWALSQEILDEKELEFDLLKPLIQETFEKAMKADHPAYVQTGPALRNDNSTLTLHQNLIAEDEDLLRVYRTLSKSIQDWHQ
ncbi:DUF2520 domain-containing protein [Marinilongibacter aquaticus]|uniref:Rossmann-like and DUF2520 domain-containing protein n=1 Tax=Marinilongibacter aquaticus TaxID=2975157 RepID=UPI0021BD0429|nr:Rossmann-like and DUF2520 domain-containing protein [Marinilongibacter aquaticus]UBM60684.1 DUF2520 domain-containing protein [Marinilongibacter aquaticus]